jgi:hypothetical protein
MIRKLALAAVCALPASAVLAEGQALGIKAGAFGLGLEYTYEFNERIAFRGGINGSEYGFDAEESGIDYDFDLVWDSLTVGVDFHPLKSAFRVSGGFMQNDNRLEAFSRPTQNVTVGDTTYTPAQVGTLNGLVGFDDTATFVGVGWDWSRGNRLFGMSFDLGLLDQGDPTVALRGTGSLLGNPAFQQDIAAEEAELRESLDDLDMFPYLTLGFLFRF